MPKATVWYGIGLIIFGAVAYTAVGMVTFSVLTPAYYGIALSTAGTVALKEKIWEKRHAYRWCHCFAGHLRRFSKPGSGDAVRQWLGRKRYH